MTKAQRKQILRENAAKARAVKKAKKEANNKVKVDERPEANPAVGHMVPMTQEVRPTRDRKYTTLEILLGDFNLVIRSDKPEY